MPIRQEEKDAAIKLKQEALKRCIQHVREMKKDRKKKEKMDSDTTYDQKDDNRLNVEGEDNGRIHGKDNDNGDDSEDHDEKVYKSEGGNVDCNNGEGHYKAGDNKCDDKEGDNEKGEDGLVGDKEGEGDDEGEAETLMTNKVMMKKGMKVKVTAK